MSTLSEEIAAGAARLVVEHGLEYGPAKRKVARELGRRGGGRGELPSNEQIEDEVRAHLALFCAQTQPAELRLLRELALRWMERLAAYRPHLAGAVWRGTATRASAVHLDLYCDDPKGAELALLDMGLKYEHDAIDGNGDEPVSVLTVVARAPALGGNVLVHLALRDRDEQRGALRGDARGQPWRGDLQALRRLLAAGDAPQ